MLSQQIESKLLPYQVPHTSKIISALRKFGGAVDGSITGSGKSFTSLAVAKELGLTPIIVAPKPVLPSWGRAAKHMEVEPYAIINYEALKYNKYPFMQYDRTNQWLEWKVPEDTIFIFDELQVAKNYETINAHMIYVASMHYPVIGLSATIGDKPEHMFTAGHITKLFSAEEFPYWLNSISYKLVTVGGWRGALLSLCLLPTEFSALRSEQEKCIEIHKELFGERGSRMNENDVKEFFPEGHTYPELIDFNSYADKMNDIYAEMEKELEELSEKIKGDNDNGLTKRLRARQEIELLKVPIIADYALSLIEEGNSVIIFTNFNASLYAFCEKLNTQCYISGDNKRDERENNRTDFQEDRERLIIVNTRSGGAGISLNDIHGKYPRVSLILPSDSAQDIKQCLGRALRANTKTLVIQKIIFAAGTVEEKVYNNLEKKINNIDTINDGDLSWK